DVARVKRTGRGIAPPARLGTVSTDTAPCTPTKLADGFGSKSLPVSNDLCPPEIHPNAAGSSALPFGRFGVRVFLSRRDLLKPGAAAKGAPRQIQELYENQ